MPTHHTKSHLNNSLKALAQRARSYIPKRRWLRRLVLGFAALVIVVIGGMYGIARWYIYTESSKPLQLGVSFIPDYASSLGVDPQANLDALLGMGVKHLRLVSYWSDSEATQGQYDFTQLDWQFKKAEAAHAKVVLTLGLRQPRWPECHQPSWVDNEPRSVWQPQLERYMSAVIERYKDSPSLDKYQLENEYFLKGFGICTDFSRDRLESEYKLVKQQDPTHPIIVGRSNNALGIPLGQPQPDEFSISVYKRVWDAGVTHRYLEYPFPAWFYGFLAGAQQIVNHKDMRIGELQAESWAPHGGSLQDLSIPEANKSLNARRLTDRIEYGKATGMREIDLWGAEYWYSRMVVQHDSSLWDAATKEFRAQ